MWRPQPTRSAPRTPLLVQLEIDPEVSAAAAAIAATSGTDVVFNASPAPMAWTNIPEPLRHATTMLVVNQKEARRLLDLEEAGATVDLTMSLHKVIGETILVSTKGPAGVEIIAGGDAMSLPSRPVDVVDAVGAGDAFLGALLAARLGGASLADAARRGVAAGAIAVTRPGAFHAQPTTAEIDAIIASGDEEERQRG